MYGGIKRVQREKKAGANHALRRVTQRRFA
jgi:hypothetical protein